MVTYNIDYEIRKMEQRNAELAKLNQQRYGGVRNDYSYNPYTASGVRNILRDNMRQARED
jgi:hypothetical protein